MSPADLPREFVPFLLVIVLLGMRHGLDADHLAAIDALTRANATARPRFARWVGVWFALGHGAVVGSVAVAMAALAPHWRVPAGFEAFGAWVSIVLLSALALLNLASVWRTPAHESVHLAGWRSGVYARLLEAGRPVLVLGVGVLFALSFDTLSQAALFALTAHAFGGWRHALLLALAFSAGMLAVDGANGLWVARLLRGADRRARVASRVMALAIAGVGLLSAALTLATLTLPGVDAWAEGKSLWFGAAVLAVIGASFVLGLRLAPAAAPRRAGDDAA